MDASSHSPVAPVLCVDANQACLLQQQLICAAAALSTGAQEAAAAANVAARVPRQQTSWSGFRFQLVFHCGAARTCVSATNERTDEAFADLLPQICCGREKNK